MVVPCADFWGDRDRRVVGLLHVALVELLGTSSYRRAGVCGAPRCRLSARQRSRVAVVKEAIAQVWRSHVAVYPPNSIRT